MTRLKVQKAEPLRLEYEDVMAAIRQDALPTVSGEDGLAVLKVVSQLAESKQKSSGNRALCGSGGRGLICKTLHRNLSPTVSTVAVVGLGKIGLPLAVQYAQHGRRVIGCDINPEVVEMVNAGKSHVQEEPELATEVARLVESGLLSATLQTSEAVRQADVVVVIVPVVVDAQHKVNFEGIDAATRSVGDGITTWHAGDL